MNKNAIKKFAIEARKKLIDSVTDKAGMLGITEKSCSEPITKGADFEVYQTVAGTEVTLNKRQCEQRRRLVSQIESRGFEAVVEEVAYTWFNRICAIRFMEVNDYLPNRVRVLSSEKEGKMEPDLVTQAPDVDLDLTAQEKEEIINWKMSGASEDTDKMFGKLFLKQCHQLHDVLPGLFEADSDYMELLFGISYTNKDDVIYMLVNSETGIPEADFNVSTLDEEGNPTGQVEIIGWLYQYYNTELKDDTFAKLKKNVKITKERIPAATQLFTPDWIVRYMVENSVGRIWIEHLRAVDPSTDEKATAERFGWKYYLPEAEQEESVNVKLAEIRTTYKELKPTDITCIDPCMGSGHILIAMFDVLMDIYESAGYDKREAAFEIVEHNIHGLDIDQRAYQLAYFAVMMKGRGYNRRFLRGRDGKPEPKVYAIVESNEINLKHLQFFGTHLSEMERNLAVMQIERLLDTFKDAREYGSILNVDACDWDVLERFVEDLGATGQISFESVGSEDTQESLRKLARIAKNLGQKYDAVVTNPPYMSAANMQKKLLDHVVKFYPDSKSDLFSVFIEKSLDMIKKQGIMSMITQQVWMFITTYQKLRYKLMQYDLLNLNHLGSRGFDEISGEIVQTVAFTFRKSKVRDYVSVYSRNTDGKCEKEKRDSFLNKGNLFIKNNNQFSYIPDNPFIYWISPNMINAFKKGLLIDSQFPKTGVTTGDNEQFLRLWFEIEYAKLDRKWYRLNKGGSFKKWYGNNEYVIDWENNGRHIKNYKGSTIRNEEYYFKEGVTWGKICSGTFSARYSDKRRMFDAVGLTCFPSKDVSVEYLLGYMNSKVVDTFVKMLNPSLSYTVGTISNLPFYYDIEVEKNIKPVVQEILIETIEDYNMFEISEDFARHHLIGKGKLKSIYQSWVNNQNNKINRIINHEEYINSEFISLYSLKEDISSSVSNSDITLYPTDETYNIKTLISYAVGCMFGRYSLNKDGLICAGENIKEIYWKCQGYSPVDDTDIPFNGYAGISLAEYNYGYLRDNVDWENSTRLSYTVDYDNVIPITDEEYFSDDIVGRFVEFVKSVYGADTLEENLDFIANALGNKGDTSREVIRNYFLKDFYADHLKVYQKRPIYWLFDSGKQNGFKALIYMHRYDADTVGRVRTDYLHRAQKYVETAMQSAKYTIDNASSASEKSKATKAVTKYTKQLAEMKIYDEAIAHIANKRIEIDLDDGVKVNYEKFQGVEVAQEGKKALKVDLLAKIK